MIKVKYEDWKYGFLKESTYSANASIVIDDKHVKIRDGKRNLVFLKGDLVSIEKCFVKV